jgi:hypothetical protein
MPHWIAGTDYLIFTASTTLAGRESDRAVARSLSTKRTYIVAGRASAARLMSPDILLFGRGSEVEAARFDPARGMLAGVPIPVARDVRSGLDGTPLLATSAQGTLVHVPGRATSAQFDFVTPSDTRPVNGSLARMREPALDKRGERTAGIISVRGIFGWQNAAA